MDAIKLAKLPGLKWHRLGDDQIAFTGDRCYTISRSDSLGDWELSEYVVRGVERFDSLDAAQADVLDRMDKRK